MFSIALKAVFREFLPSHFEEYGLIICFQCLVTLSINRPFPRGGCHHQALTLIRAEQSYKQFFYLLTSTLLMAMN